MSCSVRGVRLQDLLQAAHLGVELQGCRGYIWLCRGSQCHLHVLGSSEGLTGPVGSAQSGPLV